MHDLIDKFTDRGMLGARLRTYSFHLNATPQYELLQPAKRRGSFSDTRPYVCL